MSHFFAAASQAMMAQRMSQAVWGVAGLRRSNENEA